MVSMRAGCTMVPVSNMVAILMAVCGLEVTLLVWQAFYGLCAQGELVTVDGVQPLR